MTHALTTFLALLVPTTTPLNVDQDRKAALTSLNDSLEPLVDAFNADKGKLRFVTILSPT